MASGEPGRGAELPVAPVGVVPLCVQPPDFLHVLEGKVHKAAVAALHHMQREYVSVLLDAHYIDTH